MAVVMAKAIMFENNRDKGISKTMYKSNDWGRKKSADLEGAKETRLF
jgi:hypothetical protein